MFTKFKHAVEAWLRKIISSELSNLRKEKAELHAQLLTFDAQIVAFKDIVNALNATVQNLSEVKENNTLRQHVNELTARIAGISDTFNKIHPEKYKGFV